MATSRLNSHLSKKEIKILKTILEQDKERILSSFAEKKNEKITVPDSTSDEIDSANENILVSTNVRFFNREMLYLKKIKKSLIKIETDEYGMCEECGCEINFTRLKARPTSEMCIICKEDSEKMENQNAHLRVSKSMGKKIDLVTSF